VTHQPTLQVGLSALHVASNFSVLQGLLAARAQPNTVVPQLGTPLCCAARAGDVEVGGLGVFSNLGSFLSGKNKLMR